ncbi:MAG: CHASE3 domain-containing protein, partial [bacterium]
MSKNQHVSESAEWRFNLVSAIAALAISVGGLVLVGWALDIAALKSILPGWVSMKPNTAVAFVLIGIAILSSFPRPTVLLSRVARLCGWLAGVIGLLTLVEYISGWNPGFDQWLFPELAATVGTSNPGRMAPDTALCFALLAVGLETVRALRRRSLMLIGTVILGGLVITIAVAAISTYFTPALGVFGWCGLTNMAAPTAAGFVVLGLALVELARQTSGLKWTLGRGTTVSFAGALMLVVLLGLHSSRSAYWQAETANSARSAEQVLASLSDVLGEAAKAQAHTRGYVIAGDERYLQAEQEASVQCHASMAKLRALTVDPGQQARVVRLETQINELLTWYPQVIDVRRSGGAGIGQRDMINHGEDLMDSVRVSIAKIETIENQLLQERSRKAQSVARFTQGFITSVTFVRVFVFLLTTLGLNQSEVERKQAQETLRASEVRYRRLFEAARDGVLILDVETGMVVDVNPFLIELLGVTREVFLGKKVWELGFFKDLIANEANFAELKQKGFARYEDMAMEGHDGKRHEVEFISNVYLVNHQKVIQCNIRDISERVIAAMKIRELNEELEQRVAERTAQLDAANRELEAFSYSVSHDLRAPLRHVQGYVDMLGREAEGRLSEQGRHYMKTIADASREMGVLIDDLLSFSRMGRADMIETRVNLDTLVQDALRVLEPATRGRNIVWKIPPLPVVQADPAMLRLVLDNLLGNAVKFTRPRDPAVIEIGMMNEACRMQNEAHGEPKAECSMMNGVLSATVHAPECWPLIDC